VCVALDAEFVVDGPHGDRKVAADDFFRGVFDTALGPQDVLTEIRVPKLGEAGWSYVKFTRRAQDWATVGVAAVVRASNGGVDSAAIALTNMAPAPVRARTAEGALKTPGDVQAAAEAVAAESDPPSDTSGSAEYRRHLATVLARRALGEAIGR
jgi:carbon-monoxide dehydrogenase medium subunit